MPAPYSHTDLAYSTLDAGIAAGATSLNVAAGDGAKFPAGNFFCTIWNLTDNAHPALDADAEIILVTTRSTDAFNPIVRGQGDTSDVAHNTGGKTYAIMLTMPRLEFETKVDCGLLCAQRQGIFSN